MADIARQRDHGRRAEQADIHARRRKPGLGSRHGEVAGRDKLATGRRCHALDDGDDGLRHGADLEHHGRARRHQFREKAASAIRRGAGSLDFLQVMPGREGGPVMRQQHDADGTITGCTSQGFMQGRDHRRGKRVPPLRIGERDHPDGAAILDVDQG